jgi:hypothetical protein
MSLRFSRAMQSVFNRPGLWGTCSRLFCSRLTSHEHMHRAENAQFPTISARVYTFPNCIRSSHSILRYKTQKMQCIDEYPRSIVYRPGHANTFAPVVPSWIMLVIDRMPVSCRVSTEHPNGTRRRRTTYHQGIGLALAVARSSS